MPLCSKFGSAQRTLVAIVPTKILLGSLATERSGAIVIEEYRFSAGLDADRGVHEFVALAVLTRVLFRDLIYPHRSKLVLSLNRRLEAWKHSEVRGQDVVDADRE